MTKKNKLKAEREREIFTEELVNSVLEDFEKRKKERLKEERQWELNLNFLSGNQYVSITGRGDIEKQNLAYFWQSKGVYNHIAPLIESRIAKFSKVNPEIGFRPKTEDDSFVTGADYSEKIVKDVFKKNEMQKVVKKVTSWSESCGTGFFKVLWNNFGGNEVGVIGENKIFEGDVSIIPVSPFEIFPDSLYRSEIEDCESIIHARVESVEAVYSKYGVKLEGDEIPFCFYEPENYNKKDKTDCISNACVVIEKYCKPTEEYPSGRLITVAKDKLLYYGELPFSYNGKRYFPFIKQVCIPVSGRFFGKSVIERLIPIQRAFNAVKNRKQEFINRLSMGILTVEDGSMDVDDLAEEGLSPGKILVYRQGANPPEIMKEFSMPSTFSEEEQKLLNEFVIVSGVSDVSSAGTNSSLSSGTALEILIEQDNEKLILTAENIRESYLLVAKTIIKLFSQFMKGIRAISESKNGKVKTSFINEEVELSLDAFLISENELLYTGNQKNELIFKLYESGLLSDDNGKLRPSVKEKVLSLLGYKDLDYGKGVFIMQEEKAKSENEVIRNKGLSVEEIDDDEIHIEEHTRYILSEYDELKKEEKERLYKHLVAHKERLVKKDNINKGEKENGRT